MLVSRTADLQTHSGVSSPPRPPALQAQENNSFKTDRQTLEHKIKQTLEHKIMLDNDNAKHLNKQDGEIIGVECTSLSPVVSHCKSGCGFGSEIDAQHKQIKKCLKCLRHK